MLLIIKTKTFYDLIKFDVDLSSETLYLDEHENGNSFVALVNMCFRESPRH